MKTMTAEVVVIGAGPAGMAAALELGEAGRDVIVLERMERPGGLMHGGIGPFGVESYLQKNAAVDLTKQEAFNYLMEFTHWKTDARLVSEYINLSGDTIEWLDDMGVKFTGVSAYYPGGKATQHNIDQNGPQITDIMFEKSREYPNLTWQFGTRGMRLIKENGAVTGVYAQTDDGEELQIRAKAVVVSSGGFSGDPQLVSSLGYSLNENLFYTFEFPHLTGDGLKMIWEAGGQKAPMMMDTYIGLPDGYGGPLGTAPALAGLRQYNLMVNQSGCRFMREDLMTNPSFAGSAVHSQKGGCAIMILDSVIYEKFLEEDAKAAKHKPGPKPAGPDDPPRDPMPFERFTGTMEEIMQEAIDGGSRNFFIADSIEAFTRQAGLPEETLKETIAEYNAMCEARCDTVFYKDPRYLQPIRGPKFYGARFGCDTYGGLGGVKINYRGQVLDEAQEPIPGLYAAGNDANTVYGDCYPFYLCGNTSGFAFNSGRIAGKNAAAYAADAAARA